MNYIYNFNFYLLSPATMEKLMLEFAKFYKNKDVDKLVVKDFYLESQSKIQEYWGIISELAEQGEGKIVALDIIKQETLQSVNLLNINEILNDINDSIKDLTSAINNLVNSGITVAGSAGTFNGLATFIQKVSDINNKLQKTGEEKIDFLFAKELRDTNIGE